jgi:hypothetical protein
MHAEHADNSEMNDMSARNKAPKRATQTSWLGGYFVDPIRLLQAAPEDQTRGPWSMNRTASSACLAPAPAKAGVHRLPASALRFFLGLRRHKAGKGASALPIGARSPALCERCNPIQQTSDGNGRVTPDHNEVGGACDTSTAKAAGITCLHGCPHPGADHRI